MDTEGSPAAPISAQHDTATQEPQPEPMAMATSLAPPSSSVLSEPEGPTTDAAIAADTEAKSVVDTTNVTATGHPAEDSVKSGTISEQQGQTQNTPATINPPGWDAAREQVMKVMTTSENMPVPVAIPPAKRGGRGGKRVSLDSNSAPNAGDAAQSTPTSSGRGRGRVGRPRGRGRGGGRGGKRKREDGSDGESSDSEVATPVVTMTKSGRNVQKPTSFVPPPPSPTTGTTKRKRTYRRNPESAVCKMCLRGTSPASNMIVFCDGCNTPYHRYCHQPPIEQAVIDEVDKEWYCMPCEKERIVPVPETEVAGFASAAGAPAEQRQKYFASLPPGMLVTLLTRATTLNPDLPLFGPDFEARAGSSLPTSAFSQAIPTNGHPSQPRPPPQAVQALPRQYPPSMAPPPPMHSFADDPRFPVPDEHPANYVRPGQGLMRNLPPEQEDLSYLVDDDRHQVFSHYHLDSRSTNASMNRGTSFTGTGAQNIGQVASIGVGSGMNMGQ